MFRMEFRSQVKDEDVDVGHSITEAEYEPAIFEGRVGRFGNLERIVSHRESAGELLNSPCLQVMADDDEATSLDAEVLRELVRPFTTLRGSISEENVRADHEDVESSSISSDLSGGSTHSSFRSQGSSPSDLSAVQQRLRRSSEHPVLVLHRQSGGDIRNAGENARQGAGERRVDVTSTQRELRDLANCVSSSPNDDGLKKKKLQKVLRKAGFSAVFRFLKSPFRSFKAPKIHNGCTLQEATDTPSSTNVAPLQMQAASHGQPRRPEIPFPTVTSTQPDVPAWTTEEYMRRNGGAHMWKRRHVYDDEFGGTEGNILMNQNFDNTMQHTYDDSDSD